MKRLFCLPFFVVAALCALGNTGPVEPGPVPEPAGKCPEENNACTEDDGCESWISYIYWEWHGLRRCTWGLSGCENDKSRLCKTRYISSASGCPANATLSFVRDVNEEACS